MDVMVSREAPPGWERFNQKEASGNIFHTTEYAEILAKESGCHPYFIQAKRHNKVKAQLLCFRSSRCDEVRTIFPFKYIYKFIETLSPTFFWTYGPVGSDEQAFKDVLQVVKEICYKNRWLLLRSQAFPFNDKEEIFASEGFIKYPRATFIVDLRQPEEVLWKNIEHSARTHVRKAKELGVSVKIVESSEDFSKYMEVLMQNRKRSGNFNALSITENLWRIYKDNGMGEILIAIKDDTPLAGIGITWFNNQANEYGICLSNEAIKSKIPANDLLKWHALLLAKNKGCAYYDITGVYPDSKDKKEQGIFHFKKKWGGKLIAFNEYYLPKK